MAANDRLRRAMHRSGLNVGSLAEAAAASTKSVERWLAGTHAPHPRTRYRVASVLHEDATFLWPEPREAATASGELVDHWPRRADVPPHLWTDLLRSAERNVDLLAFAGLFLTEEHTDWTPTLVERANAGVRVRLLLGDQHGRYLKARDDEESIGHGVVAGRVAAVLAHYERAVSDLAEIRLFDAPLYNSIYRFDDDMLVNQHAYGVLAAYTPTVHLRRIDGRYFETFLESFERLWAVAKPHEVTR